ncbi:MAG TPA: ATP-binding protein [Steroidobacteraceae bacterium]|jgi:two-component system OmpR family sensor kinase/two-component system sensor histidine kinase QseC|nr:ATP-binding protein [Steroidobacteraceae bacterium]
MRSIRARLLIALIVMVALISLLAAGVTYRRVLSETSTLFDYQLRQMALSLRGQISLAPRIEVPPDQGDADFVVQIWDVFGARTYVSRPGLPMINQTVLGYADLSLQGEAWRAYGLQTADGVIQIAQPARVRENLARAAAARVVVPLILLLPIMVGAVAWIVRSGLKPLRFVTTEVQRRDVRSLAPLGTKNLPLEIAPLVGELNRLLDRLQRAFFTQRAFISDAAHELRSPLTALRLQLQLLDRAPDETARLEARSRLGAAVERAIHLVEQLLALARSEPQESAAEFQLVDISAAAAEGVQDTHDLAMSRGIDLGLDAVPQLQIRGDREGLRTLARNLIDNAVRYTPANGSVQVRTRSAANDALLEVIDNGPGIAAADRERVFDRFYRRAAAQETGTGLGLAIVRAIAERHGARVLLGEAPGGGLHVMVSFPSALLRLP